LPGNGKAAAEVLSKFDPLAGELAQDATLQAVRATSWSQSFGIQLADPWSPKTPAFSSRPALRRRSSEQMNEITQRI
jgi:hypothetical protein